MRDMTEAIPRTHPRNGSRHARRATIAIAVSWILLVLGAPLTLVFVTAFGEGAGAFFSALSDSEFLHAALLTMIAALCAVAFNTVFGVLAAWTVARTRLPGRRLISMLLDLPVAVSPVVAGLMFLLLFGRQGWFVSVLERIDVQIVFALPGIVIATIFVTMPFVAKEVLAVLQETGVAQEEAAATLGASSWQVFTRIVVPNIRWAVFYGIVLTAARAIGEFGAVSVLSGNLIGKTQTLPLFIERAYVNYETTLAFAAAVPLTMFALFTIAAHKLIVWLSARRRTLNLAEEATL